MIAIDTNILVLAHREESPLHAPAQRRLNDLAMGEAAWAVPVFCLAEFVRVVTHPKIFAPPSTLNEALAAIDGLLESETLRVLTPGQRYPALFSGAVREGDARGNLAFDAQIVAVCREQGASRLLTLDRDFSRFAGIEIEGLEKP